MRRKGMNTGLELLLGPITLGAEAKVVGSANLPAPTPSDPGELISMAQALPPCAGKRGGDTYILSSNC